MKEIRKAERSNRAFQEVLDNPDAAEALAAPGLEAAAGRSRGLDLYRPARSRRRERASVSDHISGPRALADTRR